MPIRINKYLAEKKYCTRREADELIVQGKVFINGRKAVLGDKVGATDTVDVRYRRKNFRYFAYNKPRGIITHSAQGDEKEIKEVSPLKGVFPVGRLDKDSHGMIILTDDGRVTDALLNPEHEHEKEYRVTSRDPLSANFKKRMEPGVWIEGYQTKPCSIEILGEKRFAITLTEGKKHQIRRMCAALGVVVTELERTRVMNIQLRGLKPGQHRPISGSELAAFLKSLGLVN